MDNSDTNLNMPESNNTIEVVWRQEVRPLSTIQKNTFLEKNRNDKLHNSNQKQTIQYNQCKKAYKEQVLTTGSV